MRFTLDLLTRGIFMLFMLFFFSSDFSVTLSSLTAREEREAAQLVP